MRRKFFSAVLITSLACTSTGCGAWWQEFKEDPFKQITNVASKLQSIVSIATVVFGQVKPNLPPDVQGKAQAEFDKAIVAVNSSLNALDHGLNAAAELQEEKPDFAKALTEAKAAIDALQVVVNTYKKAQIPKAGAAPGAPAPEPVGGAELDELIMQFGERHSNSEPPAEVPVATPAATATPEPAPEPAPTPEPAAPPAPETPPATEPK